MAKETEIKEVEAVAAVSLEEFLLSNPVNLEDEVKISDRIPFMFKIRAMDSATYAELQKKYTKMYRKGKGA